MILVSLFVVIVFFQILFFSFFAKYFPKNKPLNDSYTPNISVIICAKNEAQNLSIILPHILRQSYPKFEIILVNDHSTDQTLEVMQKYQKKSDIISILDLPISIKGKKRAITQAIKKVQYDCLLFTDADCVPSSKYWIKEMAKSFQNQNDVVLGYGAYQKIKPSFLNKIIRFETLHTAMQYFSFANLGMPYMGVGRNLAYRKALFQTINGFSNHEHIQSGDDDLFISSLSKETKITYNINSNAFTLSKPKTSWQDWIHQKRRHITTAHHYKPFHQFILGLFYTTQLLFFVLLLLILTTQKISSFLLFLIAIRYIVVGISYYKSATQLKETDLLLWLPIYEISVIFIQLHLFIKNIISSPKSW